jgi:hypothetical protein
MNDSEANLEIFLTDLEVNFTRDFSNPQNNLFTTINIRRQSKERKRIIYNKFISIFTNNNTLTIYILTLDLSNMFINDLRSLIKLFNMDGSFPFLRTLILKDNDLNENNSVNNENITILSNYLKNNTIIVELNLNNTNISSVDGMSALADMLKNNKTLKKLHLSENIKKQTNISDENKIHGINAILKSLEQNNTLEFLDISNNNIFNDYTLIAIGTMLESNKGLKELILDNNLLMEHKPNKDTNYGFSRICSGLQKNRTLEKISLKNTNIDHNGIKILADNICDNDILKYINLSNNDISSFSFQQQQQKENMNIQQQQNENIKVQQQQNENIKVQQQQNENIKVQQQQNENIYRPRKRIRTNDNIISKNMKQETYENGLFYFFKKLGDFNSKCNIKLLYINDTFLNTNDIKSLVTFLKNKPITHLDISRNNISIKNKSKIFKAIFDRQYPLTELSIEEIYLRIENNYKNYQLHLENLLDNKIKLRKLSIVNVFIPNVSSFYKKLENNYELDNLAINYYSEFNFEKTRLNTLLVFPKEAKQRKYINEKIEDNKRNVMRNRTILLNLNMKSKIEKEKIISFLKDGFVDWNHTVILQPIHYEDFDKFSRNFLLQLLLINKNQKPTQIEIITYLDNNSISQKLGQLEQKVLELQEQKKKLKETFFSKR